MKSSFTECFVAEIDEMIKDELGADLEDLANFHIQLFKFKLFYITLNALWLYSVIITYDYKY